MLNQSSVHEHKLLDERELITIAAISCLYVLYIYISRHMYTFIKSVVCQQYRARSGYSRHCLDFGPK